MPLPAEAQAAAGTEFSLLPALPRPSLLVTACALAFIVSAQASDPEAVSPGQEHIYELAVDQPVVLGLAVSGTALIRVRNIGRDSILTITDASGTRLGRFAGWRGPEHRYFALVETDGEVILTIEPDDPISPPGRIGVYIELLAPDSRLAQAERVMSRASDSNLAFYYGEEDTRESALDNFQKAASLFAIAGKQARRADALFEAANVSDILCRRRLTHELLEEAGSIWSDLDDQRGIAATENLRGLVHWATGDSEASIELFDSAAARRKLVGDDYFYAEAINNLGLVHREKGDSRLAAQYFRDAIEFYQGDVNLLEDEIDVERWKRLPRPPWMNNSLIGLNNLGLANEVFGDIDETERIWRRALELSNHLSTDFTSATLWKNLGNFKRKSGEMEEAIQLLHKALAYFTEESPEEYWASVTYFNLGQLHRDLGDTTRAMQLFEKSLVLRTPECDPIGRAQTLKEIAAIAVDAGRIDEAMELINQGHALLNPYPANKIAIAELYDLKGRALSSRGHWGPAVSMFDEAIRLYRAAGDRFGELVARAHRAEANGGLGRYLAAKPELQIALDLAQQVDSKLEQFRILTLLAQIHLADGDAKSSFGFARRAIDLSEAVRDQLVRPILLRDFASIQRSAYDVLVAAYLALDQVENAWIASDLGRARRFSDSLKQGDIDMSLLTRDQRERYDFLVAAVGQRAEARTRLYARNNEDAAEDILDELLPLIDELDYLQKIARRSDQENSWSGDVNDVRRKLDDDEILLEFHVGANVAGVWSIDNEGISFSEIPLLHELTVEIDSIRQSLSRRDPETRRKLNKIARQILGSTALNSRDHGDLIIIPDGPLHYLPFAALPDPSTSWSEPLISNRTITYLPSIASAAQLMNRSAPGIDGIAIVADPIFQIDDPRVSNQQDEDSTDTFVAYLGNELLLGYERSGNGGLPRLPGTQIEARAIEDVAGDVDILSLYGADANRDAVLSGQLSDYGILHFATHGIVDDIEPALSGLVLSAVTREGKARDSFLRTQDILTLSIDAELVVLSGCDTGLGRPVYGEGLVGLSRAFFVAGADRVVSSLWKVPDTATAELMARFYRALLENDASPSEALRIAHSEIREQPRWSNPYFWASFVIHGNWK